LPFPPPFSRGQTVIPVTAFAEVNLVPAEAGIYSYSRNPFLQRESFIFLNFRLCGNDIIATRPLTDERWDNFHPKELIIFRNGNIVFSSTGRNANQILALVDENELKILRVLRRNPRRLTLKTIGENIDLSREKLKPLIHSLLCKGYIRQDSRDRVKWNHDNASFYTEPSKREEIDGLIER